MSFDNRKSTRVPFFAQIHFWLGLEAQGNSIAGHTLNLSETGLAFFCYRDLEPGQWIFLQMSLPGHASPLGLQARVVACKAETAGEASYQLRITFVQPSVEDSQRLRRHILQLAEPAMGWGKTYFPGKQAIEVKYRELEAKEQQLWLEKRAFLSFKEVGYLRNYQEHLEQSLGQKSPEGFRLRGTKALKAGTEVWLEFELGEGRLHFLAKVLWTNPEEDGKFESGLSLAAFHKEEAIKLEKKK